MNKQHDNASISAIILSAGNSERFGFPKCFLKFDSSISFLEKLVKVYVDANMQDVVIVSNAETVKKAKEMIIPFENKTNISIIINEHPEEGRFSSIKLGINSINILSSAFIQNIDNPFTTTELLENMKARLLAGKYTVPVSENKRGHPVLVSSEILQDLRKSTLPETNLRTVLEKYPCEELKTEDGNIHANINTKEDYLKYFAHDAFV